MSYACLVEQKVIVLLYCVVVISRHVKILLVTGPISLGPILRFPTPKNFAKFRTITIPKFDVRGLLPPTAKWHQTQNLPGRLSQTLPSRILILHPRRPRR